MDRAEASRIIDMKDIASRLDYDFDLFRELAELFIEDSARLMKLIKTNIDNSDFPMLRKTAHTLKGSISNFSCESAYNSALMLEKASAAASENEVKDAYDLLVKDIDNLQKALSVIMKLDGF